MEAYRIAAVLQDSTRSRIIPAKDDREAAYLTGLIYNIKPTEALVECLGAAEPYQFPCLG